MDRMWLASKNSHVDGLTPRSNASSSNPDVCLRDAKENLEYYTRDVFTVKYGVWRVANDINRRL